MNDDEYWSSNSGDVLVDDVLQMQVTVHAIASAQQQMSVVINRSKLSREEQ